MGFVTALRSALASVVRPLTGRKRKSWEDEDEQVAPPVPESASRPRLQHQRQEEMEEQPQQPQARAPDNRGPQQRLDFSSPAVAAQQRRSAGGAAGMLHPRSLHQERPPQLAAAGRAAAAAPPGSSGAPVPPGGLMAPFAKHFAPPTAHRRTPAPRPYQSSLAANVRQVVEAPPSLIKMTLTPATSRLQQQRQQQQPLPTGQRAAGSQQQLGALRGSFTGARCRGAGSGAGGSAQQQLVWQQPPLLGRRHRGIELQRMPRPADSSGGVVRVQDAAVLRRAVGQQLALEARHEREREQQRQQQQQRQQPVEEVDLTGEPSSSQQPAGRPQGAAMGPAAAARQAGAAVPLPRVDWREMLERLRLAQDDFSDLESDAAPVRQPQSTDLGDSYAQVLESALLAKRKALQTQELGLQLIQQAHTALERAQPQRAVALEAEALRVQQELHDLQLQRRKEEAQRRVQQQAAQAATAQAQQVPQQAKARAAAPAGAAEEEEAIDLISSSEDEAEAAVPAASVSMAAAPSASEEEESEISQQLQHVALKQKLGPPVIPDEWRDEYEAALAPGPPGEVLVDHKRSNIVITRKDMACMAHLEWLNDEVINLYISLLLERDAERRKQGLGGPRCHFFSTFFTNKLYKDTGYNYDQVRRWTMPKRLASAGQASSSILDCDRIIVPVHQGNHWVCAVIDLQNRKFVYYDSLKAEDPLCLQHLAEYLRDEYKNKRGEQRDDVLDWPREFPKKIPQQLNGCDCGVFTLLFANYAGRAAPLDFTQHHIDDFRMKIVHELLQKHVE